MNKYKRAQPELPPEVQTQSAKIAYCAGWWDAMEKMQKQELISIQTPKKGDRVICIEDESLGTVWWTDAAGGPYVKFDDGSYGQWMLHEFGKLFRYAESESEQLEQEPGGVCARCGGWVCDPVIEQPEQEPVLVVKKEPDYTNRGHFYEGSKPFIDPTLVWKLPVGTKLYTNPPRREWQGLTEEDIRAVFPSHLRGDYKDLLPYSFARAIEAALKEKNQ